MMNDDEIAEKALIEQSRDQRTFFETVYGCELRPWQREAVDAILKNRQLMVLPSTGKTRTMEAVIKKLRLNNELPLIYIEPLLPLYNPELSAKITKTGQEEPCE